MLGDTFPGFEKNFFEKGFRATTGKRKMLISFWQIQKLLV
jgi:hypothetical protein